MATISLDNFRAAGFAAKSDLENDTYRALYAELEAYQSGFLANSDRFRSAEYRWPHDALHCWSRIWEYPYIYAHMREIIDVTGPADRPLKAVDVGSGVTFFPFALAALGWEVVCTDIDPICERDLKAAIDVIKQDEGSVSFRMIEDNRLPFSDGECDVVYCISVLEHIPDFEHTVLEMARVLKPGGHCLLTCDIDLCPGGRGQLNSDQYASLMELVDSYFEFAAPGRIVHPVDMLTNGNSPVLEVSKSLPSSAWRMAKKKMLKPMLGRKTGCVNRRGLEPLAVLALPLTRKA